MCTNPRQAATNSYTEAPFTATSKDRSRETWNDEIQTRELSQSQVGEYLNACSVWGKRRAAVVSGI